LRHFRVVLFWPALLGDEDACSTAAAQPSTIKASMKCAECARVKDTATEISRQPKHQTTKPLPTHDDRPLSRRRTRFRI